MKNFWYSFIIISASTLLNILPAYAATPSQSSTMGAAVSDSVITGKVKAKLATSDIPKSATINIVTNDGVVVLTGTLESETDANKAVQIAESVSGVRDVDTNNLKITGSTQPMQDTYITAKVKGILIREGILDEQQNSTAGIGVETNNGVVYLSGKVENKQVERKAIDLAKSISGVKQIISRVEVQN